MKNWLKFSLAVGGLLWIARTALNFAEPAYYDPQIALDYAAAIGTTLAYLFLSASLWGLSRGHALPAKWPGWLKQVGMWLAVFAAGVAGIANLFEDVLGLRAFGEAFFFGGMALVSGLFVAAIGSFLQKEQEQWHGLLLLACMSGIAFPDYYGGFLTGAALLIWSRSFSKQ